MHDLEGFEELQESTLSLMDDHLALAVDLLFESRREGYGMWRYCHLKAMSSILHAFLALEAAINLIGYELFFDPASPGYIAPEQRAIPLQLMVRRWWSGLSWIIKLEYILSLSQGSLPPRLKQELLECARMRNWIAHGNPYKQTILLEQHFLTVGLVDREVHFDLGKFSNTKLKSPAFVDHKDAHTVNRVVLEGLKTLAFQTQRQFVVSPMNKDEESVVIDADLNVDELLRHGPPTFEVPDVE